MGESIRLEDRWAGLARVLTVCREQRSEAEELVALRVQQAGLGTGEWRMELVDSGLWWISGLRAGGGGRKRRAGNGIMNLVEVLSLLCTRLHVTSPGL